MKGEGELKLLEKTKNSKIVSNPFPGLEMQPSSSDRHLVDKLKVCGPTCL